MVTDPLSPEELLRWRKERRAELIARRMAVDPEEHRRRNEAITAHLLEGFPRLRGMIVSCYWPFRGEFDPRFAIRGLLAQGAKAALPVVVQKGAALQFNAWWPGAPMKTGAVYSLPVPDGTAVVTPDALLIPPVGFDALGYRLGYGGGYFDRTLAALPPRTLKIGVGHELSRMETIRPQPHDIAMDFIVTEAGIRQVTASGLAPACTRAASRTGRSP